MNRTIITKTTTPPSTEYDGNNEFVVIILDAATLTHLLALRDAFRECADRMPHLTTAVVVDETPTWHSEDEIVARFGGPAMVADFDDAVDYVYWLHEQETTMLAGDTPQYPYAADEDREAMVRVHAHVTPLGVFWRGCLCDAGYEVESEFLRWNMLQHLAATLPPPPSGTEHAKQIEHPRAGSPIRVEAPELVLEQCGMGIFRRYADDAAGQPLPYGYTTSATCPHDPRFAFDVRNLLYSEPGLDAYNVDHHTRLISDAIDTGQLCFPVGDQTVARSGACQ